MNQARKERDEFERQLRNVTEKLHKSNAQRRTLKESLVNEKAARLATKKESNDILLKVTLEREARAEEIQSIRSIFFSALFEQLSHALLYKIFLKSQPDPPTRASAKQQVAAEKQMTEKLNAHKLKLKACLFLSFSWPTDLMHIYVLITLNPCWLVAFVQRRLQESRRSLSDADAQLRVERHTNEQLQAEITHRAQQFDKLKDEISNIQKNMEEARQANEVSTALCFSHKYKFLPRLCSLIHPSIHICTNPSVFFQAEKGRLITQLKEANKVESDLRAKLAEEHNLLETAQRLIDREQEVATNLRKDIVSREDDLAKLQIRFEEQSERNAEMESLLEQRQNALNELQENLNAKLEDEQKCSCLRIAVEWLVFVY